MYPTIDHKMLSVPIDIETDGKSAYDQITVVGVELEMGSWIGLQTGGRSVDPDRLTDELVDRTGQTARVHVYDNERELLEAVRELVRERVSTKRDERYLTAFNGETWYGGFDVPFFRRAFGRHNIGWSFCCLYVDVYPSVKKRINTEVDGEGRNTLVDAYDILIDGPDGDYDPFNDSLEAVEAWGQGRWVDLLAHNQSDIRRTAALMRYVERYVPKSDLNVKDLSPVG